MNDHEKLERVPFSWEHSAGVSKITPHDHDQQAAADDNDGDEHYYDDQKNKLLLLLPPPPLQMKNFALKNDHDKDDPFLAAFMECTKAGNVINNCNKQISKNKIMKKIKQMKMGSGLLFGCNSKSSITVRDDAMINLSSKLPADRTP